MSVSATTTSGATYFGCSAVEAGSLHLCSAGGDVEGAWVGGTSSITIEEVPGIILPSMALFRPLVLCYHTVSDTWNDRLAAPVADFEEQLQTLVDAAFAGRRRPSC